MPLGSVHTINVSAQCLHQLVSKWFGGLSECTLLPLVTIVARDSRFEQHALIVILGLDKDAGFIILQWPCQRIATEQVVVKHESNLRQGADRRKSRYHGHTSRCS